MIGLFLFILTRFDTAISPSYSIAVESLMLWYGYSLISVLFFMCAVQSFFAGMTLDNIIKNSKQTFELKLIDCERELKDRREENNI